MEVHYVYRKCIDENDPVFRKIQEFCELNEIELYAREFCSITYEEDRDYILQLPALQIYKEGEHRSTAYPNFRPIQFLQLENEKIQLENLEFESKKQIWEERIKYLKRMFRSSKTDSKSSILDSQ